MKNVDCICAINDKWVIVIRVNEVVISTRLERFSIVFVDRVVVLDASPGLLGRCI